MGWGRTGVRWGGVMNKITTHVLLGVRSSDLCGAAHAQAASKSQASSPRRVLHFEAAGVAAT